MKLKNTFLVLLSLVAIALHATPHHIKIKINGLTNQRVLLAHYFANNTKHADDTTFLDAKGAGVFANTKNLEPGIYLVIFPDYSNIELLLGTNQAFEIEAWVATKPYLVKFNNSPENTGFILYTKKTNAYNNTIDSIIKKDLRLRRNSISEYHLQQLSGIKAEYRQFKEGMKIKYSGTFLEELINSEMAELNMLKQKTDIMVFKNISFLYTPYFERTLLHYLDTTLIKQDHDSVKIILTQLFNNAFASNILYQYISTKLLNHYRFKPRNEDLFLYVAENYFIPFATWGTTDEMYELNKEVAAMKLNMVGTSAPNFYFKKYSFNNSKSLNDTTFVKSTLYQIQGDYIILYFMDSDCEGTDINSNDLVDALKGIQNTNISFLYFNTQFCRDDILKWDVMLKKAGVSNRVIGMPSGNEYRGLYMLGVTPSVYILDKNKKIVARKIQLSEIKEFLGGKDN